MVLEDRGTVGKRLDRQDRAGSMGAAWLQRPPLAIMLLAPRR